MKLLLREKIACVLATGPLGLASFGAFAGTTVYSQFLGLAGGVSVSAGLAIIVYEQYQNRATRERSARLHAGLFQRLNRVEQIVLGIGQQLTQQRSQVQVSPPVNVGMSNGAVSASVSDRLSEVVEQRPPEGQAAFPSPEPQPSLKDIVAKAFAQSAALSADAARTPIVHVGLQDVSPEPVASVQGERTEQGVKRSIAPVAPAPVETAENVVRNLQNKIEYNLSDIRIVADAGVLAERDPMEDVREALRAFPIRESAFQKTALREKADQERAVRDKADQERAIQEKIDSASLGGASFQFEISTQKIFDLTRGRGDASRMRFEMLVENGDRLKEWLYMSLAETRGTSVATDRARFEALAAVRAAMSPQERARPVIMDISGDSLSAKIEASDFITAVTRSPDMARATVFGLSQATFDHLSSAHKSTLVRLRASGVRFALRDIENLDFDGRALALEGFRYVLFDTPEALRRLAGGFTPELRTFIETLRDVGIKCAVEHIDTQRDIDVLLDHMVECGSGANIEDHLRQRQKPAETASESPERKVLPFASQYSSVGDKAAPAGDAFPMRVEPRPRISLPA